jgi:acyl-CoA thioesterase
MVTFAKLLTQAQVRADGEGCALFVPESWHQGRTAYGGFSSALALAEALRIGGALAPLRSAQIAMMAPLAGEVKVNARIVREGRNATWITVEVTGEKGVGVSANFVFMRAVASALQLDERPPPADLIPVEEARTFQNENAPAFLRHHLDVRFATPRRERRGAELCWWVRAHEHDELDPALSLMLTADGLPPAVMPLLATRVPVSTMHWQVSLLTPAPATRDGWWLLRSTTDYAQDGCSSQRMAAWNSDGEAVLAGMQSVAIFG